ncbi:hypothetical protein HK096_001315, partial [Nowakowskiella sp. JEL0078]
VTQNKFTPNPESNISPEVRNTIRSEFGNINVKVTFKKQSSQIAGSSPFIRLPSQGENNAIQKIQPSSVPYNRDNVKNSTAPEIIRMTTKGISVTEINKPQVPLHNNASKSLPSSPRIPSHNASPVATKSQSACTSNKKDAGQIQMKKELDGSIDSNQAIQPFRGFEAVSNFIQNEKSFVDYLKN